MSALPVSLSNFQNTVKTPQRRLSVQKRKTTGTSSWTPSKLSSSESREASPVAREEWPLVQQAIDGNSNAKEQIFTLHTTILHRRALSILRNKEDAEDAVQDALCRAYARLRSFQGRSTFSTWLTRIVINSALMIRRRRSGRPEASLEEISDARSEPLQHRIIEEGPNPEDICRTTEMNGIVAEEIRQLPSRLREAIQLCYLDGLSVADSSRLLGIRQSAFKSRLVRARRKLAIRLREPFETLTSREPHATSEIPSSEIVFSSQSLTNRSSAFRAHCMPVTNTGYLNL